MKIAILTIVTPQIAYYTKYTSGLNNDYAVTNGYDHYIIHAKNKKWHPSWNKLFEVTRLMDDYDWIMVLDADAVIQDKSKKLEEIIATAGESELLICDDIPNGGVVNCGVMFLKSTKKMRDFIAYWIKQGIRERWEEKKFYEQTILRNMIEHPEKYEVGDLIKSQFIKVYPYNTFNSSWRKFPSTDFVAHVMGREKYQKERIQILQLIHKRLFTMPKIIPPSKYVR